MRKLAAVALGLLLQACAAYAGTKVTAITGATLVNSNGDAPLVDAVILVRDQRIQKVGKAGDVRIPRGASIVEAKGKWIIPALVDGHVHFFQSGGLYTRPDVIDLRKHVPYAETELKRIDADLSDTFARYIRSGITAVADVGGPLWNFSVRERARATAVAPRVAVAGPLISTVADEPLAAADPPIIRVQSAAEAVELVRRQAERKPDFVKVWYVVQPNETAEDHFPMISAALAEAHRLGIRTAVHATELATAKAAVRAGADILVHSVFDAEVDEEFIQLLKARQVIYVPTLVVYEGYRETLRQRVRLGAAEHRWADPQVVGSLFDLSHLPVEDLPPHVVKAMAEGLPVPVEEIALRNLKKLHDAGVAVAAGTDAGNIGTLHGPALFREFELMTQAGLTPQQILVTATRNGAALVGLGKDLGVIEKGRLADLVILAADPLADIRNTAQIHAVMKDGVLFPAESILRPGPEEIVQRQVNAYNAHDLEAFVETYDRQATLYDFPGKVQAAGHEQIRKAYGERFDKTPRLHAQIMRSMNAGPYVIHDERVSGIPGDRILEAIAIYEVQQGLIRNVWFMEKPQPAAPRR